MPGVPFNIAILCGIMNIVIPGSGTFIATFVSEESNQPSNHQLVVSILQFLTSFLLIGYIWAFYWSFKIGQKSQQYENEMNVKA